MNQMNEDPLEREKMMNEAKFAIKLGMRTVKVDDNGATVLMDTKELTNALGSAHGGAIFSLADQAFALAANRTSAQVGISASINYIKPARGLLKAVSHKVGESSNTSIWQVDIFDNNDDLVAVFQGIGYKLRQHNEKSDLPLTK